MKKNPRARRDAVKRAIVQDVNQPEEVRRVEVTVVDNLASMSERKRIDVAARLIGVPVDQLRAWLAQRGAF